MSKRKIEKPVNRSIDYHRTKYKDGNALLEKAFADHWEKENEPITGLNHGNGILQDLMLDRTYDVCGYKEVDWLTNKERQVAATAIQWLGTNCGFNFLQGVLKSAGYSLNTKEHDKRREARNDRKWKLQQKLYKKEEHKKLAEGKMWDVNGKIMAILDK